MRTFVKVCPKCGSVNIANQGIRILLEYCKDCGYGIKDGQCNQVIFPEIDFNKLDRFREELKKQKEKKPG